MRKHAEVQYILLSADAEHEEDLSTVTVPLYDDHLLDENLVEEYLTEEIETADDDINLVFESDPLNEVVETVSVEDVYSCNVCGIEFSSVQQHIDEYHSEQEVVLDVGEDGGGVVLKQEAIEIQDGGFLGNTDEDTEEEDSHMMKQEAVAAIVEV